MLTDLKYLFHSLFPLLLRQQIDLVDDDEHRVARDLSDDETLGRLSLDPLRHVHHQQHQVDYLKVDSIDDNCSSWPDFPTGNLYILFENIIFLLSPVPVHPL